MAESIIPSTDLEKDLERYIQIGYRLDMITPADAPRLAQLSKNGKWVLLVSEQRSLGGMKTPFNKPPAYIGGSDISSAWVKGRAGMMYRDLIPGRAGGRIVASHIRLAEDGPVPDYVHYHKVQFQMIHCLRGRIRVVYEDQGSPFWLEAGDCVLQPPEIRHRVLESLGRAEVVEISMPAVHETWVEHELDLPSADLKPDRNFGGQLFCRYIAAEAEWQPYGMAFERSDTGIAKATSGLADVRSVRSAKQGEIQYEGSELPRTEFYFCFVTSGELKVSEPGSDECKTIGADQTLFCAGNADLSILMEQGTQFLEVSIYD